MTLTISLREFLTLLLVYSFLGLLIGIAITSILNETAIRLYSLYGSISIIVLLLIIYFK